MSETFSHDHYVPILKAKLGEYGALQTLTPPVRMALTPLLEVPPVDWDYKEQRPKKTIDQHLKKVGQKIERAWGHSGRLFVDLPAWIPGSERMSDGEHPLHYVFRSLRTRVKGGVKADQRGGVGADQYLMVEGFALVDWQGAGAEACAA